MNQTLFLLLIISCSISLAHAPPVEAPAESPAPEVWQKEMLNLTNQIRRNSCRCGRKKMPAQKALQWNNELAKAAQKHAEDMHKNKFIGHYGSNGSRIGQRVERAGYHWQEVAENVAWNVQTVNATVQGWRDSPGHCRNIMGNYKEMGAAKVGEYWVQVFASPMN